MISNNILQSGLIVSCQATTDSPFRDSKMMAAMARAASIGGAVGIRANGPDDIKAIKAVTALPIIGIYKQIIQNFDVFITPTLESAREVILAGADLIAVDATDRLRPGEITSNDFIRQCKSEFNITIMADISTFDEAMNAIHAGVDIIATTLVGYTPYSHPDSIPDFELIEKLVRFSPIPVVVEGHVSTPSEARLAFDLGAYAVVVGAAITQPQWITRQFVNAIQAKK
jgi:N-acylglucosamine-6-phosphate 2-epimerase